MRTLIKKQLLIDKSINANLYISTAFPLGNHLTVMDFIKNLQQLAIPGLKIHYEWYIVHHDNFLGASIEGTLELMYGKIK